MKSKQFVQSVKRFTAALALSCLLFVGTVGVQPVSTQAPETIASVSHSSGLIPGLYVPQGNYWSG